MHLRAVNFFEEQQEGLLGSKGCLDNGIIESVGRDFFELLRVGLPNTMRLQICMFTSFTTQALCARITSLPTSSEMWCRRSESNRHGVEAPRDFESGAHSFRQLVENPELSKIIEIHRVLTK